MNIQKGTIVKSRPTPGEKPSCGKTTGGSRLCSMEGCGGERYGVRWADGKLTWLCDRSLELGKDGEYLQLV